MTTRVKIGIPTYNRLSTLKRMAQSFYESNLTQPYSICVYDDASIEYGEEMLQTIFPNAKSIYRHPKNVGADVNMMYMYKKFLESADSNVFFNADADLIFSKGWLERGIDLLKKTDGILSIYNTPHHPSISEDNFFVEKENLGAAGTFFTKDAIKRLFDDVGYEKIFSLASMGADFAWSKYFRTHGFRLYSTKESLVQHIGFIGYNCMRDNINYGTGFMVDSSVNGQIINDALYEMSIMQVQSPRRAYALFPFELVHRDAKVVLYGYGNTGKDFSEQIKGSGYCRLIGIVDAKHFDNEFVYRPQILTRLDFDYLILATIYDDVASSMREIAKSILPDIESKIIYKESNALIRL